MNMVGCYCYNTGVQNNFQCPLVGLHLSAPYIENILKIY